MPAVRRLQRPLASPSLALALALVAGPGCERPAEPPAPGAEPAAAAPAAPRRHNLLLITIDTLRADALGVYGQTRPTSPNLDALARKGTLFEHCLASVPSTLPSHASILTGRQPYSHGVRANAGYALPPESVTLAEVLRDYGYRTAAEIAAPVIGRRTFLNQGFEHYRDLESADVERLSVLIRGEVGELVERSALDVTKHATRFLLSVGDRPFFLWLHYFDPHAFYTPPEPFRGMFPGDPYHGEVRFVDEQFGQVMRALHRADLDERTLVVVTSDHGEGLGDHGEETHAFFVYDSTLRVPLIFWAPGLVPAGQRIGALVRSVDIAPTLLDLLGLFPLGQAEGVSLRPLIDGARQDLALAGYGESLEPVQLFGASMLRTLRSGEWKYIHKVSPELYSIRSDPGETRNLASERPEIVEDLRGRLRRLLEAAPEPRTNALAEVDPVTRAHLVALGYAVAPALEIDELASLEVKPPDQAGLAGDLRQYSVALSHAKSGRLDEAERLFRELWERHPRAAPLLMGLVEAVEDQGRTGELEALLRAGVALGGSDAAFQVRLARLRAEAGAIDEAEALLRDALGRAPCSVVARVTLSNALGEAGRFREQLEVLEEGVERCPDATDLTNDLAFALATVPEDSLRDGPRALALARQVVGDAPGNPAYLDTLAAALAETGNYADAQEASRRAVELVLQSGMSESVAADMRAHLETFEAGRPLRR